MSRTSVSVGAEEGVQVELSFTVNGSPRRASVDTRTSLLDLLREHLGLTGSKKGCDHGQCGACTVLMNGRRVNACLVLAVMCEGAEVVTVEGLANGEELASLQLAFVEHDALQCGYCTPGQLCSAVGMLREVADGWASSVTPAPGLERDVELSAEEIRERMSGNICRCGAYVNIVAAIGETAR
jgi:xanthine dehydrogenase YagT iron-sulfur-binding subunit